MLGFKCSPSTANATDEITLGNAFHSNLRCNDTSISSLSDGRDKTDIVDSTYGVEWLKGVKVRKYKWQSRDGNGKDGLTRLGFIAQELQEACGDCNAILDIVQENNPDKLEVKMGNLVPILTKAIQELTARIEDLEANRALSICSQEQSQSCSVGYLRLCGMLLKTFKLLTMS
jgi:trimeric autotransporter adhesin